MAEADNGISSSGDGKEAVRLGGGEGGEGGEGGAWEVDVRYSIWLG